ncbi:MAG: hypothetical protein NT016_00145 [Candidatus Aenigmarchaeota archaeon]|nr:hypothetical protein [Candidatus Aenigmarchaeota archaeon]
MKTYALLALLVGVVALSGCIGQSTTVTGGKGLAISSFGPDFNDIRSGEPVYLSAMVTNVGEYDATGISAQLFGINIGGDEWSLASGAQTQTFSTLRRSDSTMNLPGESQEFVWNLNSPAEMLVDNTYTANVRLYYKYGTQTTALLKFITYDYLKSLPTSDVSNVQSTAGVSHTSSSAAPIAVSLNVGSRPLVVYKDGDQFMVEIILNNADIGNPFAVGATYPPAGALQQADLYKVNVAVTSDLDLNCANSLGGGATSGVVTLTKGATKAIFCTATIASKNNLGNMRDYAVTVTTTYGYYVDSSTDISVMRSEASLTGGSGGTGATTTTAASATTTTVAGGARCVSGSVCTASDLSTCPPLGPADNSRSCVNGQCCYY